MANDSSSAVDTVIATWADARSRIERFGEWRRRLAHELAEFPEAMEQVRRGAANFELVGERLAKSSASLEEIADLYQSTIAESGRRSAQAVDELRKQIDGLAKAAGSPERLAATMDDVQRGFEAIANLNPFWPGSKHKP